MSDFVAVLKRTLDGLGETTPDIRKRVYDKARATIAAKLEAMNPPPSPAVANKQRRALEDAIAEVESGYRKPEAKNEPLDELEHVLNSLNGLKNQPLSTRRPEPAAPRPVTTPKPPAAEPRLPAAEARAQPARPPEPRPAAARPTPVQPAPAEQRPRPETPAAPPPLAGGFSDLDASLDGAYDEDDATPERRKGGAGKYVVAAVLLAAIGAGGYFGWQNRDRLTEMVAGLTSPGAEQPATPAPAPETPAPAPATPEPSTAVADPPAAPEPPAEAPAGKFTQQLNADGTEVDAGPVGGEPGMAEGTSVAAATPGAAAPEAPAPSTPPAQPETPAAPEPAPQGQAQAAPEGQAPAEAPPAAQAPAATPPAAPAGQEAGIAVAQKAIFYEERTNNAAGSAEPGNVVWSVVQESPGNDLPPEPAIRGEATIPSKNIQLRMTIRRNADRTLPASQIIEMIFITPQNVEGGGVANVLRVALKGSEQDPGTPLTGIPAKISDGFFLVALSNVKAEETNNAQLLETRSWLDIPLVYQSGRRALVTLEKGIPGEKVFQDVIKSWSGEPNG